MCFIPLGYLTGHMMSFFTPLKAYSINIAGSLLGIWVFSALSFFQLPPLIWFGFGFFLFLWLVRGEKLFFWTSAVVLAAFTAALGYIHQPAYWSPYYRIDVSPYKAKYGDVLWGYRLNVNKDYHQKMLNLSNRQGFPLFV